MCCAAPRPAAVGPVVVATDSREVEAAVQKASGRAVVTRSDHASGSDRIFEGARQGRPRGSAEIIVNLQADLPTIGSADIAAALAPLADAAVDIATLVAEIERAETRRPQRCQSCGHSGRALAAARALFYACYRAIRRRAATTTTLASMPSAGPRSSAS